MSLLRLVLSLALVVPAWAQPQTPPQGNEEARHRFQIPQEEYDKTVRVFNPVNFRAGEQNVKVSAKAQGTEAMNLEAVVLKPVR